ncbi:hypothetical protein DL89DRAFT_294317 [Linderina pennispora]|uniref:Uncharacterized protein n=1 Tax=Linderina pennispora TaxID=61395 RepID=A0A1Y1W371_9FUNG|nr:uncharacterized protein DL89DRAFT_294317 [Linderina pennispora]ORX67745.1 hypothetical protein DL89DRAFT_294317 [Linderina pennispora]
MARDNSDDDGSDSDDHGFVKVDRWKSPTEPEMATFTPTLAPSTAPTLTVSKDTGLMSKVRNTLKTALAAPESTPRATKPARHRPRQGTVLKEDAGSSSSDCDSSGSDSELEEVIDETELELIEAMEDAQISEAAKQQEQRRLVSSPGLRPHGTPGKAPWVGLGDSGLSPKGGDYNETLKQRFTSKTVSGLSTLRPADEPVAASPLGRTSQSPAPGGTTVCPAEPAIRSPAPTMATPAHSSPLSLTPDSKATPPTADPVSPPPPDPYSEEAEEPPAAASTPVPAEHTGLSALKSKDGNEQRPASVPLDAVEFVAPGVTKQTAMSLLRRVLDIEGPVIQQKMVEFLLIDGVIASLIGFITHAQGSIYSPSSSTQTTPGESPHTMQRTLSSVASELPNAVLEKFEHRNHGTARQGLSDTDLRRGYNAAHMLVSRDQYARRVVEAKLSVIVPSLMAVFHKDSLGSFHHACMLLEHCLVVSPMKTARMLLFHQNPPSRWWAHSAAVAKGQAPICDLLPYMSEPCVQQLFLKAEFGVWTGRLMTSLGLSPNDAVVVTDALNRDAGSDNPASAQQRSKALQLVRNRFSQLNRGGFMDRMVELIEDPDAQVSESVSEFLAFMINDCSMFLGFNILFKPIYDSERPVRRLAQLIINSPPQRLSPQAKSATRFLQALLMKTSCQYGLRVRDAQGVHDPEVHARGSQLLLQVGQAARTALESFLPGLFATVVGLQASTDLTTQSAFNRRISVESLRLPEYDEADPDLDTDDTEAAMSSLSDNGEHLAAEPGPGLRQFSDDDRSMRGMHTSDDESDLRNSAAALLHATYSESISSGSISSSLSPSSTLSASPMNIASGTPERPVDSYMGERLDAEELGLLVALPKPDIHRLSLLKICVEVLRETDDIDETVGWVDLRVWRALTTWFLNHPHNNMLHLSVYQLVSTVTLEAVRLRQARRRYAADPRGVKLPTEGRKPGSAGGFGKGRSSGSTNGSGPSNNDQANGVPEIQTQSEGSSELRLARRRARRRRAMAERIRREEATNCDNILTYMVEQNQWIDKLVRRATSPNFDGAYGYISLILNTLRLAVQVDRRKWGSAAASANRTVERTPATTVSKQTPVSSVSESEDLSFDVFSDALQALMVEDDDGFSDDEVPDDSDLLPDLAYHDPSTRRRLSEYPLYRLQRWEISLLYSPSFRTHLRRLRKQAVRMVRKLDSFRLCDQSRTPIIDRDNGQRPVPYLSPQRIRPPVSLDNSEIKKKQLQINVGLLLGNNQNSSSVASKLASASGKDKDEECEKCPAVNDVGIDADSLFARMLGFTEDIVELPAKQADERKPADTAAAEDAEKEGTESTKKPSRLAVHGKSSERPVRNSSSKRKKSKPSLSPSMRVAKVSEILEDMSPDAASEAAEAICNALGTTSSSNAASAAKHSAASSSRLRKKAAPVASAARRRRSRLQHRSSNSSLSSAQATDSALKKIEAAGILGELSVEMDQPPKKAITAGRRYGK